MNDFLAERSSALPLKTPSAGTKHFPRLDSLRGIAAFMVAGAHGFPVVFLSVVPQLLFGVFLDGRIAVCIFFVLSGIVLGMSLRRSGPLTTRNFTQFCVRRFFRLYPAYFVCTVPYLLLFLYAVRFPHETFPGAGIAHRYHLLHMSSRQLVENFTFQSQALNGVTWTLKVEAYAALILPFLHLYTCLLRWRWQVVMLLALIVISLLTDNSTRINLWLFYGGYQLPRVVERLHDISWRRPELVFALALLAALTAFFASHTFGLTGEDRRFGTLFAGAASLLLLGLLLAAPAHPLFRFLEHPVLRFLGAISYSFYLLNICALDLTERLFLWLPGTSFLVVNETFLHCLIVFIPATFLSVVLSTLSYHLVERPSVQLGARLYRS